MTKPTMPVHTIQAPGICYTHAQHNGL